MFGFDMKLEQILTEEQLASIRKIINSDSFKEINEIIMICDLEAGENEIINQIKDYISLYVAPYEPEHKAYQPDSKTFGIATNHFISFMEKYFKKEPPEFETDQRGFVIISGSLLYPNLMKMSKTGKKDEEKIKGMSKGFFNNDVLVATDGSFYIMKDEMQARRMGGNLSKERQNDLGYNPVAAEEVFKFFNLPTASYKISFANGPYKKIITKSFLKENQEMIGFNDFFGAEEYQDTYSKRIRLLENNIKSRYGRVMDKDELNATLDKLKLQYCKQEFIKRVIGPIDNNIGNSSIVLTSDGQGPIPQSIDISPAYDLDLTFEAADEWVTDEVKCDNGKSDIQSIMEEFRTVNGFDEFINEIVEKMREKNAEEEIMKRTYKNSKMIFFKPDSDNYKRYVCFLQKRFQEVQETYRLIYNKETGDEEDELVLE